MSRTSKIIWTLVGLVVAIIAILGAIYGPDLYRRGKGLVEPIVDISRAEDSLRELNTELPFTPPEDGSVTADRLTGFLEIRRSLLPRYQECRDMEALLEKSGQEDWNSAMDLLAAVKDVISLQTKTLRSHEMSPAEFVWIEEQVYLRWFPYVADAVRAGAGKDALRESTNEDLEVLAALERQHGSSSTSLGFANHLRRRLDELGSTNAPEIDGMAAATSELLWAHRHEIEDLDFTSYSELHKFIRGEDEVEINIKPS